jgi:hypothetical protein
MFQRFLTIKYSMNRKCCKRKQTLKNTSTLFDNTSWQLAAESERRNDDVRNVRKLLKEKICTLISTLRNSRNQKWSFSSTRRTWEKLRFIIEYTRGFKGLLALPL